MRYIILVILMCSSALGAEKTNTANSLAAFAKQARESYEKKDGGWMLKHSFTNGVPGEILAAQDQFFRSFWGKGSLQILSVETFRNEDYKPIAAPGEFQDRKLRFITKPTHWVVLEAGSPKPKDESESASKTQITLEFPVFEKNGEWKIVNCTYAE